MQTPQQIATGVVNEFPGNEGNNLIKVAIIAAALQAYGAACASEMREQCARTIDDEIARIAHDDPKAESEYFSAVCFHLWQRAAVIRSLPTSPRRPAPQSPRAER